MDLNPKVKYSLGYCIFASVIFLISFVPITLLLYAGNVRPYEGRLLSCVSHIKSTCKWTWIPLYIYPVMCTTFPHFSVLIIFLFFFQTHDSRLFFFHCFWGGKYIMLLLRVRGRIIGGQPSTMAKGSLFQQAQSFGQALQLKVSKKHYKKIYQNKGVEL